MLLIAGGNYLTDGAVAVAQRFKVSSLMIGLTVVALGSSMPDIAVCVESALENKTEIAVGNIIGADIFDLLLVVGAMGIDVNCRRDINFTRCRPFLLRVEFHSVDYFCKF